MVDGRCLPVVWFQGSVDGQVYLELLKNTLWPAVRANATRKKYWYQHDGATCHVTTECLDLGDSLVFCTGLRNPAINCRFFLRSKFDHRVLSRRLDHHWPTNSPDLSPMDFSFWSQASNHLKKLKPATLEEMKLVVHF